MYLFTDVKHIIHLLDNVTNNYQKNQAPLDVVDVCVAVFNGISQFKHPIFPLATLIYLPHEEEAGLRGDFVILESDEN
jgi:hypothetical protein